MSDADFSRMQSILIGLAPQGRAALLPALHLAQQIHGWLSEAVELFRSEGLVSDTVRPEFDAVLQRLTRRLDSVFPELMLLALAFASAWAGSITSIGPMI